MSGPMLAPCLGHGRPSSLCRLDLRAVGARKCELVLLLSARLWLLKNRTTPSAISARVHDPEQLRREIKEARAELRLLYAVRAHHRGKVHEIQAERFQRYADTSFEACPKREANEPHLWRPDYTHHRTSRGLTRYCCAACLRPKNRTYDEFARAMLSYQRSEIEDTWDKYCRVTARVVDVSDIDGAEVIELSTGHTIQYGHGQGGDGYCSTHSSFSCLDKLTPRERDAVQHAESKRKP